jgi:hypothetical protein
MGHEQTVIDNRQRSSWVGIARDDAREWWRDHPGSTFSEFAEWVADRYEPYIFTSGFGWRPARHARMTAFEREILDDVHVGLHEAAGAEVARRRARRRRDEEQAA